MPSPDGNGYPFIQKRLFGRFCMKDNSVQPEAAPKKITYCYRLAMPLLKSQPNGSGLLF